MLHRLFFSILAVTAGPIQAQRPLSGAPAPSPVLSNPGDTTTTVFVIKHHARLLGDRAAADGTRFFSVQDSDLAGKSRQDVLKRLSPSEVRASDGIRKVEVAVELARPLTVVTESRDPVLIGGAVVRGRSNHSKSAIASLPVRSR